MTSITWAGPRCVQEPAAILAPQNRTQGRCVMIYNFRTTFSRMAVYELCDRRKPEAPLHRQEPEGAARRLLQERQGGH